MSDDPPDKIVAPPIDMRAVGEAADVYLSDPTTRAHQIGVFALDLSAVVAANDEACRVLADPQLSRLEKRKAVATALLIELLRNRLLYQ